MTNEQVHGLQLQDRSLLQVSGVSEIERFDEQTVLLQTAKGLLLIRGSQLQLQTLSIEGGQVRISGCVDALSYEEGPRAGGFWRRLFG